MALKIDVQHYLDEDGNRHWGDCSIVPCSENDPHRLRSLAELREDKRGEAPSKEKLG